MVGFLSKILGICIPSTILVMTIVASVFISPAHHITAQTLESILQERNAFKNNPQINLRDLLGGVAVDPGSNKVYVTDDTPLILCLLLIVIQEI